MTQNDLITRDDALAIELAAIDLEAATGFDRELWRDGLSYLLTQLYAANPQATDIHETRLRDDSDVNSGADSRYAHTRRQLTYEELEAANHALILARDYWRSEALREI